jgi:hypothetical protein
VANRSSAVFQSKKIPLAQAIAPGERVNLDDLEEKRKQREREKESKSEKFGTQTHHGLMATD